MDSGEVKTQQRQPVLPTTKKRRRTKPDESANGGSSSSGAGSSSLTRTSSASSPGGGGSFAAGSSSLSRTSSSSPPSGDADGKGQQQEHEQGGKRPRLVWTTELHDLFVEAYDSLGDEAVPRRILEKMNEKMNVPEISREKVASHLQKHKLHLRRLAEEASSCHSPTKEAPAASHHPLRRSLITNTAPLAEVLPSQAEQLELVQQVLEEPPNCLSRSGSSITANLQIVQSTIQQQQLCGPPIKEGQARSAQTMQRAPAPVDIEAALTAAILVPEANAEEDAVMHMVQAANAENAAEAEEAAPAPGCIIGQFWASPDNEPAVSTSSWDIFVLPRGTS